MRRLLAVVLPALFLAATGAPAGGQVPIDREALRRGLIYDGLQRVAQSDICKGNFRVAVRHRGVPICTHGPDPAPAGVDVRADRMPPAVPGAGQAAQGAPVPCVGNGNDGFRVQLI